MGRRINLCYYTFLKSKSHVVHKTLYCYSTLSTVMAMDNHEYLVPITPLVSCMYSRGDGQQIRIRCPRHTKFTVHIKTFTWTENFNILIQIKDFEIRVQRLLNKVRNSISNFYILNISIIICVYHLCKRLVYIRFNSDECEDY